MHSIRCAVNCKLFELASQMYSKILDVEPRNGEALSFTLKCLSNETDSVSSRDTAIASSPFGRRSGMVTYVLSSSTGNWARFTIMICSLKSRRSKNTTDGNTDNHYGIQFLFLINCS